METTPKNKRRNPAETPLMNLCKSLKRNREERDFCSVWRAKKRRRKKVGEGSSEHSDADGDGARLTFIFSLLFTAFYPTWEKLSAGTGK
jgi:hypothetical protein